MIERVHLGWRIPEDVWDAFQSYVAEKHGATAEYLRFEMESAMREYLDEDDLLAEAEDLLREYTDLKGLSSSTAVASIGTDRYHGETTLVQHRVNSELKERFQMFADEHDQSYGRLLAAALDSYTDGGRERRILDDVERLLTGTASSVEAPGSRDESTAEVAVESESTTGGDENPLSSDTRGASSVEADSGSVDVEARLVLGVLEELPDASALADTVLPKSEVKKAVVRVVEPSSEQELAAYRDRVLEQLDASEHPHKDGVYVTAAYRDGHRLYDDMDRPEAVVALRRFVALDAVDNGVLKDGFEYTDVQALFESHAGGGAPSHDHAYTLMELAGEKTGFEYGKYRGSKQLRVDLSEVPEAVLEWVCDEAEGFEEDLDALGVNGRLEDYGAGSPPETEGSADD